MARIATLDLRTRLSLVAPVNPAGQFHQSAPAQVRSAVLEAHVARFECQGEQRPKVISFPRPANGCDFWPLPAA
jgi:hypothetical protein